MNGDAQLIGSTATGALSVGALTVPGRAFLAPMAGVTDLGMRRAAARFGAGLVVSEMLAADFLEDAGSAARARGDGLDLHVVQVAARDPSAIADAARMAIDCGADMVDINMGCPARRVVGGYAGAALMREPDLAASLVRAVVAVVAVASAGRVPVSVKMRLGWDEATKNAPEIARRAELEGAAMVAVHGRTRNQFYKGAADWAAIADVRAATALPLVANGDCASLPDARDMLRLSGADAVMIGRAAVGRPWLVGEIAAGLAGAAWRAPAPGDRTEAALAHLDALLCAMGRDKGLRHARKHLAAYADVAAAEGFGLAPAERARLVETASAEDAAGLLAACWSAPGGRRAA